MRSILEELFYGNICPNTDCRSSDKEIKELKEYISLNLLLLASNTNTTSSMLRTEILSSGTPRTNSFIRLPLLISVW